MTDSNWTEAAFRDPTTPEYVEEYITVRFRATEDGEQWQRLEVTSIDLEGTPVDDVIAELTRLSEGCEDAEINLSAFVDYEDFAFATTAVQAWRPIPGGDEVLRYKALMSQAKEIADNDERSRIKQQIELMRAAYPDLF